MYRGVFNFLYNKQTFIEVKTITIHEDKVSIKYNQANTIKL